MAAALDTRRLSKQDFEKVFGPLSLAQHKDLVALDISGKEDVGSIARSNKFVMHVLPNLRELNGQPVSSETRRELHKLEHRMKGVVLQLWTKKYAAKSNSETRTKLRSDMATDVVTYCRESLSKMDDVLCAAQIGILLVANLIKNLTKEGADLSMLATTPSPTASVGVPSKSSSPAPSAAPPPPPPAPTRRSRGNENPDQPRRRRGRPRNSSRARMLSAKRDLEAMLDHAPDDGNQRAKRPRRNVAAPTYPGSSDAYQDDRVTRSFSRAATTRTEPQRIAPSSGGNEGGGGGTNTAAAASTANGSATSLDDHTLAAVRIISVPWLDPERGVVTLRGEVIGRRLLRGRTAPTEDLLRWSPPGIFPDEWRPTAEDDSPIIIQLSLASLPAASIDAVLAEAYAERS